MAATEAADRFPDGYLSRLIPPDAERHDPPSAGFAAVGALSYELNDRARALDQMFGIDRGDVLRFLEHHADGILYARTLFQTGRISELTR